MNIRQGFVKLKYRMERIIKQSLSPVSILLIFCLKVLSPLVKIKFCPIIYTRIGHLAGNTEIFLRRLKDGRFEKGFKYVGVSGKPCNRQLMRMIKRQILVIQSRLLSGIIKSDLFQRSGFFLDLPFESNEYNEFNNLPRVIGFTKEEEKLGARELKKMGIGPDDWFVCFHNRDSVYLDRIYGFKDWSYHDYRDCSITNFIPAMEYIASLGGYAIRMGQYMAGKIDVRDNPKIIDYASCCRSDFMDIYLAAHCKFFVGNTAGLHLVPVISDVPIIMTNTAHAEYPAYRQNDLFILKKIRKISDGTYLAFSEIFKRRIGSWLYSYKLRDAGIELIENTPEEILAVVKEMNFVLDGKYKYSDEDNRLQKRYWSFVEPSHFCYGCPARVGKDFLAQNEYLLNSK